MTVYNDILLDHYHTPRYKGILATSTHCSTHTNPTCGDSMQWSMTIDPDTDTIRAIGWDGNGCAISQAAASLLAEHLYNAPRATLAAMDKNAMLTVLGISVSPARLRCALLALETAQRALTRQQS